MKFIVILTGVVVAVSAMQQETFKMPPALVEKIKKHAVPCADENNLDHSVILKVASGSVPDTEAGRNFVYCFARATGYVSEDGHLDAEKIAEILKDHPLQEQFRNALNQCNEITKETPQATAMAMHKCFAEKPPVRFVF